MNLVKIFLLSYSKRTHNLRPADNIQLENDWVSNTNSHIAFDNPAFGQDQMYESISKEKGSSVAEKIKQVNDADGSSGVSNPIYDMAGNGDHGIEGPELRHASLEKEKESNLPQHPATDDENYEKIKQEDQSRA